MLQTPKPFNKYLTFVIVLAVLILVWLGSYWLNYKTWPWSDLNKAIENSQNSGAQNNGAQLDEKEVQEKQNELFRQGTMNDLAGKISEISPAGPGLGGKWEV